MKTRLSYVLILLCAYSLCINAQVIVNSGGNPEYACPGSNLYYELQVSKKIASITWTVKNGSFSPSSEETTHWGGTTGITVYWKKVKVLDKIPEGTLSARIIYQDGTEATTNTFKQKIKSFNDIIPPNYTVPAPTELDLGIQTFYVGYKKNITLHYDNKIIVTSYEWTLPNGWKEKTGKTGTFISSSPQIQVTTDFFGEGDIKVKLVNDCNTDDKSLDTKCHIKRKFSFTNYPNSIKYGNEQQLTYTVSPIKNATYEWSIPSDWETISGANSNSIVLLKKAGAISADIKVRVKSGTNVSPWLSCPNKTINPPDISIPKLEQLRNANISIGISNDKIADFSLSCTGCEVLSGQGSNTLQCRFSQAGNKEISFSIKLKESSTPFTFKKTVEISPINLSITIPTQICPDGTLFNIANLPAYIDAKYSLTGYNTNAKITEDGLLTYPDKEESNLTIYANLYYKGNKIGQSLCYVTTKAHIISGTYQINGGYTYELNLNEEEPSLVPPNAYVVIHLDMPDFKITKDNFYLNMDPSLVRNYRADYDLCRFSFTSSNDRYYPAEVYFQYKFDWGCGKPAYGAITFRSENMQTVSFVKSSNSIHIGNATQTSNNLVRKYEICNINTATILKQGYLKEGVTDINASDIPNGFYVVRIIENNNPMNYKIAINR